MKTKIVALMLFAMNLISMAETHFEKECMTEMSLEKLHEMRREQLEIIKKTDDYKKTNVRKKEFRNKQVAWAQALSKCQRYKDSWYTNPFYLLGYISDQDCEQLPTYEEECILAQAHHLYARHRVTTLHPDFVKLEQCILEREYNRLSVDALSEELASD